MAKDEEVDVDELEQRACKGTVADACALTSVTKSLERVSRGDLTDEFAIKLVHASRRIFSTLIKRGDLTEKSARVETETETETALSEYFRWIQAQFRKQLDAWAQLVAAKRTPQVHVVAVRTLFHLYQRPCDAVSGADIVEKVVMAFLASDLADEPNCQAFRVLKEEYLEQYDDVRYHFLRAVERIGSVFSGREEVARGGMWLERLADVGEKRVARRVFQLLLCVDLKVDAVDGKKRKLKCLLEKGIEEKGKAELSKKQLRKAFQTAWLAFLKLRFDKAVYRNVLGILGERVLPNCTNPLLLSEFLIEACDMGGSTALLALEALFMLMSQHGLEYPDFYKKLYNLIDSQLFASKKSAKLYTLIDLFLTSSHLSHHMVAAFIKKFARLSLSLTPPGILVSLVFIHNLIKRHPSTLVLVHKTVDVPGEAERRKRIEGIREASRALAQGKKISAKKEPCLDPYRVEELDPLKSNAGESSLWELSVLQRHYSPAVVSLVNGMFMEELAHSLETKKFEPPIPLADFASASYTSMFLRELKRKSKKRKLGSDDGRTSNAPALAIKRSKDGTATSWSCLNF